MDKLNLLITIEEALYSLIFYSATTVTKNSVLKLEEMLEKEKETNNKIAQTQLQVMIENIYYAQEKKIPVCQDTGLVNIFIQLGEKFPIISDFKDQISKVLKKLSSDAIIRANTVDPINFYNPGDNSGQNMPPIYLELIPNHDDLIFTILNKGGGSENISMQLMLNPATGFEDFIPIILETIKKAGGKPCPPIIVGLGIGGDAVKSMYLAKKSLLRPIGSRNSRSEIAELENKILSKINSELNIGIMGLGGHSNCIDVHIEWAMRHPASYPVGLIIECYSHRKISGRITKNGEFYKGFLNRDFKFIQEVEKK